MKDLLGFIRFYLLRISISLCRRRTWRRTILSLCVSSSLIWALPFVADSVLIAVEDSPLRIIYTLWVSSSVIGDGTSAQT